VKTSTVKLKELNPVWKEDFVFSVESVFGQLEFTVEDDDMLSNDFMGKITLPIATLWNQAEWKYDDYPLSSKVPPSLSPAFFRPPSTPPPLHFLCPPSPPPTPPPFPLPFFAPLPCSAVPHPSCFLP
jgi:hypothetical protein